MAASGFTLYLFGSSVPWGFPYAPTCTVGTIAAQIWSGSVNGAEIVVRNEAHPGAPSRYVLERARSVARRTHAPGSAVALVYSGNNEFIHLAPERGTLGRGPALMSADERDAIVADHRGNLEASIVELRRSGVEVVLSTVPTNLRDWPPAYMVLAGEQAENIERRCSRARAANEANRAGDAEALLGEILRSDPEFAQAHFLMGQVCLAAGRPAEARSHLVAANDFDGLPIRATSAINGNVIGLAADHGVRLLDAEAGFAARACGGICGNAQFWDNCHPKLDGFIQLAGMLSSHIADVAGVGCPPPVPSVDEVQQFHGIDEAFLADVYARMGQYCYKQRSDIWDSGLTLGFAESYVRRALTMAPTNVEAHITLALVLARRGDENGARDLARAALELSPERALWLLNGREARANLRAVGIGDVEQQVVRAADNLT